ncbi:hypothetical protein FDG2_5266 [Candidatus Protofrankia californiensis]|uniref:Uncharacterized protein n=1 Tax=Candidatus Protofrankia californiensis TaxID=1839754 RepID=A0A1C3PBW2_9ACTN|nr:hypothetical protein FDG2_5266 [Candidatus Protofrankia californiensis]
MTTPSTTPPTVVGLLHAARAELVEHGWYQGDLVSDTGCLCLIGALRRAAGCSPLEEPSDPAHLHVLWDAERELARPLQLTGAVTSLSGRLEPIEVLAIWNDQPDRHLAHVIAHLDAVADDLTTAGRAA